MLYRHLRISILFLLLFNSPAQGDENIFQFTQKNKTFSVIEVQSPDTLVLKDGRTIRLLGIKGPEAPKQDKVERNEYGFIVEETDPTISLDVRAMRFAKELLLDKDVRLEFDIEHRNDDGELQAYVFIEDMMVNTEILKHGYAKMRLRSPNVKYYDEFRKAYREARENKRGLMGEY